MYSAAHWGHGELVSLLLAAGADRDAVDSDGATPLWAAAAAGHAQLVPLLATPANINKQAGLDRAWWCAPLGAAADRGHEQAVAALLAAGAQAAVHHSDGCALIIIVVGGQWGVVRLLLASVAADCHQHPKEQARLVSWVTWTAGHLAKGYHDPKACSHLLEVLLDVSGSGSGCIRLLRNLCTGAKASDH
jgi:hypothetical protein